MRMNLTWIEKYEENFNLTSDQSPSQISMDYGILLILISVLSIPWLFFKRMQKQITRSMRGYIEGAVAELNSDEPIQLQADKLPFPKGKEISLSDVEFGEFGILGAGKSGNVKIAVIKDMPKRGDRQTVAVKMIKKKRDINGAYCLAMEAKLMAHIGKHENVVYLVGASTKQFRDDLRKADTVALFLEYCCHGDLQHFLCNQRVNFQNLLDINGDLPGNQYESRVNLMPRVRKISVDGDYTYTCLEKSIQNGYIEVEIISNSETGDKSETCSFLGESVKNGYSQLESLPDPEAAYEIESGNGQISSGSMENGCIELKSLPYSQILYETETGSSKISGGSVKKGYTELEALPDPEAEYGTETGSSQISGGSVKNGYTELEALPDPEAEYGTETGSSQISGGSVKNGYTELEALPDPEAAYETETSLCKISEIDRPENKSALKKEGWTLDTNDLVFFCFQIARGMAYLKDRGILHGDLAARNILVCENGVVKIADFDLSKQMTEKDYYRKTCGDLLPVAWMAPEAIREIKISAASDVWSFGVLMWEIFTLARTPYADFIDLRIPNAVESLLSYLKKGNRLPTPEFAPQEACDIMDECWRENPEDRPRFTELIPRFKELLDDDRRHRFEAVDAMNQRINEESENSGGAAKAVVETIVAKMSSVDSMRISAFSR